MAIIRVPQDFSAISQAVEAANSGDTILVSPGVYQEMVSIPNDKPGIRIIADDAGRHTVILDGLSRLAVGFLIQANNIEVKGFTIMNFLVAGVRASAPPGTIFLSGTKLAYNRISHIIRGAGVEGLGTFATLLWKNRITGAGGNGINLQARDTWVVGNEISANQGNGIATLTNTTVGNMFIANRIISNGKNGVADSAGLNLIYENFIIGNGIHGIHELSGQGSAGLVGNTIRNNQANGIHLDTSGNMVTDNVINSNQLSGVRVEGDFNTIEGNRISGARTGGVFLSVSANGNLVIRNQFLKNLPVDVVRVNPNNDVIENCCSTSLSAGLCPSEAPDVNPSKEEEAIGDRTHEELVPWIMEQEKMLYDLETNLDEIESAQSESLRRTLQILQADRERVSGDTEPFQPKAFMLQEL